MVSFEPSSTPTKRGRNQNRCRAGPRHRRHPPCDLPGHGDVPVDHATRSSVLWTERGTGCGHCRPRQEPGPLQRLSRGRFDLGGDLRLMVGPAVLSSLRDSRRHFRWAHHQQGDPLDSGAARRHRACLELPGPFIRLTQSGRKPQDKGGHEYSAAADE